MLAWPRVIVLIDDTIEDRKNAINVALQPAVKTVDILSADQVRVIEDTKILLQLPSRFPAVIDSGSSQCSLFLTDIVKLITNDINLGIPRANGDLLCNDCRLNGLCSQPKISSEGRV